MSVPVPRRQFRSKTHMQDYGQTEDDDVPMGCCLARPAPVLKVNFMNHTQYKIKVTVTPTEVNVLDFLEFSVDVKAGAAGVSAGVGLGLKLQFDNEKPNAQEVVIEPHSQDYVSCRWSEAKWTVTLADAAHMYKSNECFDAEDGMEIPIPGRAGFACHCLNKQDCPLRPEGFLTKMCKVIL